MIFKNKSGAKTTWFIGICCLLLLFVLAFCLTGCGDTETEISSSEPDPGITPPKGEFSITASEGMDLEVSNDKRSYTLYVPEGTEQLNLLELVTAEDVWDIVSDGEAAPRPKESLAINATLAAGAGHGFTIYYGESRAYTIRLYVRFISYVTVTFEDLNGSNVTLRKGTTVQIPADEPKKEGYTFSGWDFDFSTKINKDTLILAKWTPNTYTITYNTNGGQMASLTQTVTYDEAFELPTPTKDGFRFLGWKNGEDFFTASVWTFTRNIELTAAWDAHAYLLTFDAAGGTVQPPVLGVSYGETYELPTPVRPGYIFEGWYADGVKVTGGKYMYLKDMVYQAHWSEGTFTVVYVTNGGEPMESEQLPFSQIGKAIPVREGYTFGGWFYDIGFTQITPRPQDGTVIAYACWKEETSTRYFEFEMQEEGVVITRYINNTELCVIPAMIGGKPVIAIGDGAFSGCDRLFYLSFPSTVKALGNDAFAGCTALRRINSSTDALNLGEITSLGTGVFRNCRFAAFTMPETLTEIPDEMFDGCTLLATFNFGNVTTIGQYAFRGCAALREVVLPSSARTIGEGAFQNCSALQTLTLPAGIVDIPAFMADGCRELVTLTNFSDQVGLLTIGEAAFRGCAKLSSLVFPSTVRELGASAFENCLNLTEVQLPAGVSVISDSLFAECRKLKSVTLSGTVTAIGNGAFLNCQELLSFPFNEGLRQIGETAFSGCRNLTVVLLPATLETLGQGAFKGCLRLSDVTIPVLIHELPESLFENCVELSHLTANGEILSIGAKAFSGAHLSSIDFLEQIEFIGEEAFSDCLFVEEVTIGGTLVHLADRAFAGCLSLSNVIFRGTAERWKSAAMADAFADCSSFSGIPTILGTEPDDLLSALAMNGATGCYWAMETGHPINDGGPVAVIRFVRGSLFYNNLFMPDPDHPDEMIVNKNYVWHFLEGGETFIVTNIQTIHTANGGYVILDISGAGFILTAGTAKYPAQLEIYDASGNNKLYTADLGELTYKSNTVWSLKEDPNRTDTQRFKDFTVESVPAGAFSWNNASDDNLNTYLLLSNEADFIFVTEHPTKLTSYSILIGASGVCYPDALPASWTLYGGKVSDDGTVEYVAISEVTEAGITSDAGVEYNFKIADGEAYTHFKLVFQNTDAVMFAELHFYIG